MAAVGLVAICWVALVVLLAVALAMAPVIRRFVSWALGDSGQHVRGWQERREQALRATHYGVCDEYAQQRRACMHIVRDVPRRGAA